MKNIDEMAHRTQGCQKEIGMQVAMIGLGRMGMNMARRLMSKGHRVVAYNRTAKKADKLAGEGAVAAYSLDEVANLLDKPRAVWMMLPAGSTVDDHIGKLLDILAPGDMIVEGKQLLQGRPEAGRVGKRGRDGICGCWSERGDLGSEGGLLPDDRRVQRVVRAP